MNIKFQVGDRAKLNDERNIYNGNPGTIVAIDANHDCPYQFMLDIDEKDGFAFWYDAGRLTPIDAQVSTPQPQQTENPNDFSASGLGIGGLGNHVESPIIPTVAQMERLDRMEASATYCSRCGQSDVFDGAMFTTGGGSVCDDCF